MQIETAPRPTNGLAVSLNGHDSPLAGVGEGRRRVIVERITPQIDGGRYAVKRVTGEPLRVEADIFADGHDVLAACVRVRRLGAERWDEAPMSALLNDRWAGELVAGGMGAYEYTVLAWVDRFMSWSRDLAKRITAGQDITVDLLIGAALVDEAAEAADAARADQAITLRTYASALRANDASSGRQATSPELAELMAAYLPRRYATSSEPLPLNVDRERARYSTWYELFPRSASPVPGQHGTFKDVQARLPYVAELGFDVLYLTPIHPIGRLFRKGKDNSPTAQPGEPGSPYAIGSEEGGHKSVHPELGTLEDFRELVRAARDYGIEIALDNAFQCAPDHPYVKEHPEWFRARPDGTIQYAENPPKKYQDIYPFDFETRDWQALWLELKSYFDFWIEQGVKIFRVDNPHTKSFRFWEWCIGAVKREHPEVIFLAEAFTRPKVMYNLAKLGFNQSYTYFTWRTERWDLTEYMTELTQGEARDFFRPNFWPNTHDILTPQFYPGQRATFLARLALAATLTASYGIYGPAYELMLHQPVAGREEYIDNEKYELRHWDLDQPGSLRYFIARVNQIRRENPALQSNESLRFHRVNNNYQPNDQLIAYSKVSPDGANIILTIVNLDPYATQFGWVELPLAELGLDPNQPYQAHDLISNMRYSWSGAHNYVELNPYTMPVHIFVLRRRVRGEHGFEYYA
jgi:starch synthase (maltosyl-transferring)